MSTRGVPGLELTYAKGLAVTIVAGMWHEKIATALIEGAVRVLSEAKADFTLVKVPGSFELPLGCKEALESGAQATVALGVIIRGQTPHFEYVSSAATLGLTEVALQTNKPVGFGVLTVDDEDQAIDRAGLPGSTEDKGAEAAEAALYMALRSRGHA